MSIRPESVPSPQPARRIAPLPSLAIVIGGSLILAIAAHVAVPFWPVPITLQTLAVMLIGAAGGPALAVATVVVYLAEGLAGLPMFSHGGGLAALMGPTGGYLIGYVPAAFLAGFAAHRGWLARPLLAVLAFAAADAVIFAFGLGWLSLSLGWSKAVAVGLTPFLLAEVIKIGLATALIQLWRSAYASR